MQFGVSHLAGSLRSLALGLVLAPSLATLACDAREASACPVLKPDREALVEAYVSPIGRVEIEVHWYEEQGSGSCSAYLAIPEERLPSAGLLPSTWAILDPIGPIVKEWGTSECMIGVRSVGTSGVLECRYARFGSSEEGWWQAYETSCWVE